jgi:uncharacterized membrane protein YkvA (DUF1232 family)
MNKTTGNNRNDILDEYYTGEELSELETQVLAGNVEDKIERNKQSVFRMVSHLKALKNYLLDEDVKWYRKSVVVAALIYFVTPLDAIPDFTPFAGFLDDLGVIAAAIKFLGSEIKGYYE